MMDLFVRGKFLAGMRSLGRLSIQYHPWSPYRNTDRTPASLHDVLEIPASQQIDGHAVELTWSERAMLCMHEGDEEKEIYLRNVLEHHREIEAGEAGAIRDRGRRSDQGYRAKAET